MYSDYYSTYNHSSFNNDISPAIVLVIMIVSLMLLAGAYVITSFALMRIFKKAGLPAWKAWVPFYNQWLFLELGGYNGALSLLAFASFVPLLGYVASIASFVYSCLAAKEISAKLDKSSIFILYPLGILTGGITTIIWYFMVASGDSQWNDIAGKESLAKGTILGYQIVEEEQQTQPAEKPETQEAEVAAAEPAQEEKEAKTEEKTEE